MPYYGGGGGGRGGEYRDRDKNVVRYVCEDGDNRVRDNRDGDGENVDIDTNSVTFSEGGGSGTSGVPKGKTGGRVHVEDGGFDTQGCRGLPCNWLSICGVVQYTMYLSTARGSSLAVNDCTMYVQVTSDRPSTP